MNRREYFFSGGSRHTRFVNGTGVQTCALPILPQRQLAACKGLKRLATQKYSVTRYRVTRYLYEASEAEQPQAGEEFIPLPRLASLPMASPDRKLIARWASENLN